MFHGRLISVSLSSECHYIAPQEENCIASEKKKSEPRSGILLQNIGC